MSNVNGADVRYKAGTTHAIVDRELAATHMRVRIWLTGIQPIDLSNEGGEFRWFDPDQYPSRSALTSPADESMLDLVGPIVENAVVKDPKAAAKHVLTMYHADGHAAATIIDVHKLHPEAIPKDYMFYVVGRPPTDMKNLSTWCFYNADPKDPLHQMLSATPAS